MGFKYKEQYAVIVICKDEEDQKDIYNRLKEEGYNSTEAFKVRLHSELLRKNQGQ